MIEPQKWTSALGSFSDTVTLPDEDLQFASFKKLFPALTQVPLSEGGVAPQRTDFNTLFKLLGDNIFYIQHGGVFSYSDTADYEKGSLVKYNDNIYLCIQDNSALNKHAPNDTGYWSKLLSISNLSGYITNPINSDLIFNNALRILRNDNDKYLIFVAGSDSSISSSISINGINRDNGSIHLISKDSNSNSNSIKINADGTVIWNSDNLKTVMANCAMPSDTYTTLSVGSSGTKYTAPKNGYFYAYGNATATNGFIQLEARVGMRCFVAPDTYLMQVFIPAKKNEVMTLIHQNITKENITLKFVECIGG